MYFRKMTGNLSYCTPPVRAIILEGLHGVRSMPFGLKPNFCPSATLTANDTFQTPTGPTLLIVRHIHLTGYMSPVGYLSLARYL